MVVWANLRVFKLALGHFDLICVVWVLLLWPNLFLFWVLCFFIGTNSGIYKKRSENMNGKLCKVKKLGHYTRPETFPPPLCIVTRSFSDLLLFFKPSVYINVRKSIID